EVHCDLRRQAERKIGFAGWRLVGSQTSGLDARTSRGCRRCACGKRQHEGWRESQCKLTALGHRNTPHRCDKIELFLFRGEKPNEPPLTRAQQTDAASRYSIQSSGLTPPKK